jgi:inhibitor of cysteine peptidase
MARKLFYAAFLTLLALSLFTCDGGVVSNTPDTASRAVFTIAISPGSGRIGTVVRISSGQFTPTNNTVIFSPETGTDKRYQIVLPASGGQLQFAIPVNMYPFCHYLPGSVCPAVIYPVVNGPYLISVKNANGTSNSCRFTVVGPQPPPSPVPGAIPVTDADNGRTIALKKGNVMQLTLKTNPSTGYGWQSVSAPAAAVLKLDNHYLTLENPADGGKAGAPEIEYWIYSAAGAGSTSMELAYRRSWETVPPLKTFKLTITVSN